MPAPISFRAIRRPHGTGREPFGGFRILPCIGKTTFGRDKAWPKTTGLRSSRRRTERESVMNIIITLIIGGIIGWLASIVMRTDAQQGILLNIVVGIVGAFLGNILGGMFGMGASLSTFSPVGLLWAFIGAVVLLGIINLFRRGAVR
jgi:uncharacterized membrane protein YeaQ/YmgE (transglycosylase-associated protein family)